MSKLRLKTHVLGIKNHGNTCYISSIVQCLRSLDSFMEMLRELELSADARELLYQPNADDKGQLVPSDNFLSSLVLFLIKNERSFSFLIVESVNKYSKNQFPRGAQSDAHEFLVWAINNIQELVKTTRSERLSEITRLFDFDLNQTIVCEYGHESVITVNEKMLCIEIDSKEFLSIQRHLDNYFKVELMNDRQNLLECDRCQKQVKSRIHKRFNNLPLVLVVQLKIFKFDSRNDRFIKLTNRINIHQQIDLSAHLDQNVLVFSIR